MIFRCQLCWHLLFLPHAITQFLKCNGNISFQTNRFRSNRLRNIQFWSEIQRNVCRTRLTGSELHKRLFDHPVMHTHAQFQYDKTLFMVTRQEILYPGTFILYGPIGKKLLKGSFQFKTLSESNPEISKWISALVVMIK